MKINVYLYKNEILIKKDLNMKAFYDKTNARLKFKDEETDVELDLKTKVFKRINKEYTFILELDKKLSTLTLNNYQQTLNLQIEYLDYEINKETISIEYLIETNEFKTKVIIKIESGML